MIKADPEVVKRLRQSVKALEEEINETLGLENHSPSIDRKDIFIVNQMYNGFSTIKSVLHEIWADNEPNKRKLIIES